MVLDIIQFQTVETYKHLNNTKNRQSLNFSCSQGYDAQIKIIWVCVSLKKFMEKILSKIPSTWKVTENQQITFDPFCLQSN